MPKDVNRKERYGKQKHYRAQVDPLSLPGPSDLTSYSSKNSKHRIRTKSKSKQSQSSSSLASNSHSSLYSFNPSSQCWSPISSNQFPIQPSIPTSTLKILTYNTWSCNPQHSHYQETALLQILRGEEGLDIIALQEVSAKFANKLKEQDYIKRDWTMTGYKEYLNIGGNLNATGVEKRIEAVVILVRKGLIGRKSSVEFVQLDKAQGEGGKALVVVKLCRGDREVLRIMSSHFSSLPINAPLRIAQYNTALHHLSLPIAPPRVILLADFNNSTEEELQAFHPSFSDTHQASSTDLLHASPTFGELYPFFPGKNPKRRKLKRVDRILFRGFNSCENYYTVGEKALVKGQGGVKLKNKNGLDGCCYASDHLGVVSLLS